MKPTDFGYCLSNYLISYLPGQKNLSPNTIKSYRDTYKLLLSFMKEKYTISPERLTIKSFDRDSIDNFLVWLERGEVTVFQHVTNAWLQSMHYSDTYRVKCQSICFCANEF